jgi:hypothetical protein
VDRPVDTGAWIVTTAPEDDRAHSGGPLRLRAHPPKPVFAPPPPEWPVPRPQPGAAAAARALGVLDALRRDPGDDGTLSIPNAPGPVPDAPHHPSVWDLVIVIDTGASMPAWYPTVDCFVACAHDLPLFADVHIVKLHSQRPDDADDLFDAASVSSAGLTLSPRKKVVLVLTDGVGAAWSGRQIWRRFRQWSARYPLAILHLQPHADWPRSALHTRPLKLRSSVPGGGNGTIATREPEEGAETGLVPAEPVAKGDLIVPVMELRKPWVEQWCRLVLSDQWVQQQVLVVPENPREPALPAQRAGETGPAVNGPWAGGPAGPGGPGEGQDGGGPADAAGRVVAVLAGASPRAAQLARLLAAAPLNRHIMQLVADRLVPFSHPADLAEVLSSGLIRAVDMDFPDDAPAHRVTYDFDPGVRAELLSRDSWERSRRVAELVEEFLSPTVRAVEGLAQRVEYVSPPDALVVDAANLPFVQVELAVLMAMPTGPHKRVVRQMKDKIDAFVAGQGAAAG